MNIYTIYMATNRINGKVYVGFDSNWPNRQNHHRRNATNGTYTFYKALQKYGWDAFDWTVLFQGDDLDFIRQMEIYCIAHYEGFTRGYNMTMGGESLLGFSHSDETKRKMSLASKGKPKSAEHCKALSVYRKANPTNYWLGKKRDPETNKKISQTKKGYIPWNKGKTAKDDPRIAQYGKTRTDNRINNSINKSTL